MVTESEPCPCAEHGLNARRFIVHHYVRAATPKRGGLSLSDAIHFLRLQMPTFAKETYK